MKLMGRLIMAPIVVLTAWLAFGCSEQQAKVPCIGKITKLYTEAIPPTTIIVGGDQDKGIPGVGVPVGGGTKWLLYITREDGSQCSRRVSKGTWLNKHAGDSYTWTGKSKP